MAKEFETKILDIDVNAIISKLKQLKAQEFPEILMRRWIFDMDPSGNEWIRLRDDGKKATLTYKLKSGTGISETEEIEVEVSDFEKTADIISKIKFHGKYYQENKRKSFKIKNIAFEIDSWPKIPPHLEIESISEANVLKGLKLLGLENRDAGNMGLKEVYLKHGLNMHSFKTLKF